jgi:hypothetical protein
MFVAQRIAIKSITDNKHCTWPSSDHQHRGLKCSGGILKMFRWYLCQSNTTSLLQPIDQGIIKCVKVSYTNQDFEMFRAAIDSDPKLQVMECWKSFSIPDAITFITPAMD